MNKNHFTYINFNQFYINKDIFFRKLGETIITVRRYIYMYDAKEKLNELNNSNESLKCDCISEKSYFKNLNSSYLYQTKTSSVPYSPKSFS